MAARRIASIAARLALGALMIDPRSIVVVDAQRQFPDGSIDVGGPHALPGSTSGSGDTWMVSGSVGDIWGSSDKFRYVYSNHTGDVMVTCRVKNFTKSASVWQKGGIMFRGNLRPQSKHSMMAVTGWGVAHQSRRSEWGSSESLHDGFQFANVWLRLVKRGNTVTSYYKRDGEYGYMSYNSVEVDLGQSYHVGLAVTMNDAARLGTLEVTNLEISNAAYSFPGVAVKVGTTANPTDNLVRVKEEAAGVWTINTGGTGIGGTSDSFGLVYQERTGDVNATMLLTAMARRSKFTRGGLMIRAGLAADAAHVGLLVDPDRGVTMYSRANAGATTDGKNLGVMTEDVELRLVKTGNSVLCLYRQIGAPAWYELGTAVANFGETFLVGQAMASGEFGAHAQLTMGDLVIEQHGGLPVQ